MIFVVDLDGTFSKNDLFVELLINKFFNKPKLVIKCYLKYGVLGLKQLVFNNYRFSYDQVLINNNVLEIIEQKKALGYTIVLATASPQEYANFIAERWEVFDKAFGSNNKCNLKGQEKLNLIFSISNGQNFEYIGDSKIDNIIYKHCVKYYKVINYEIYEFTN